MNSRDNSAENFLQRWSRRKKAARIPAREAGEARGPADAEAGPSPRVEPLEAVRPAFDPASLPPVESISAASDVRAFLAPGVPGEIARAALRRAWVTDPAIRDFVGLAENQWDFTSPGGVPGFGTLDLTPELRRMVADLFRSPQAPTEPAPAGVVQAIGNLGEGIPALTPMTTDKPGETPADVVADASTPGETPAQAAAGGDPVNLAGGAAGAALPRSAGPTDGLSTSLRRRHGRAVPG